MMNGIEILNSYDKSSLILMIIMFVSLAIIVCFMTYIIASIIRRISVVDEDLVFISMTIFAVIGLISFAGYMSSKEIHYEVTISEDVSFVEFYDKYDVVKKEGLIYTIKEKKQANDE